MTTALTIVALTFARCGTPFSVQAIYYEKPTGYAACMTFRHRHFRLSRLIETVEFDGERSRANTRIKRRQRLRYNGAEKEVVCFS